MTESSDDAATTVGFRARAGLEFEYRVLTFDRSESRSAVRQALTDQAEYGRWELHRVVTYWGGTRKAWLRRKIIRVSRTA